MLFILLTLRVQVGFNLRSDNEKNHNFHIESTGNTTKPTTNKFIYLVKNASTLIREITRKMQPKLFTSNSFFFFKVKFSSKNVFNSH